MKSTAVILIALSITLTTGTTKITAAENNRTVSLEEIRLAVVVKAGSYLGIAYHFGGEDARGLDCSGFVRAVFADFIPEIPRRSMELYYFGKTVDKRDLRPGDLVFFNTTGRDPSHVGVYIGENHFIHSASGGDNTGVIISSLDSDYYADRYTGSRRVVHLAN